VADLSSWPKAISFVRFSNSAGAANEVQHQRDQGYDQQNVNHRTGDVKDTPTQIQAIKRITKRIVKMLIAPPVEISDISRDSDTMSLLAGTDVFFGPLQNCPIEFAPEYLQTAKRGVTGKLAIRNQTM
jgi:hypothetical protein